jgi:hypothetical protein
MSKTTYVDLTSQPLSPSLDVESSSEYVSHYPISIIAFVSDSDLSPVIDIHLPSPSMKKTHGRQTSYQGACIAKLSISRASHSFDGVLATHHCCGFEVEVVAGSVTF